MATTLTPDQIQANIDAARAAGYAQSAIDAFIASNGVNDTGRLLSALAPNPGPGGGLAPVVPATGTFAIPTPLQGVTGAVSLPSPSDGVVIVHGSVVPAAPAALTNPVTAAVPASSSNVLIWLAVAGLVVAILSAK